MECDKNIKRVHFGTYALNNLRYRNGVDAEDEIYRITYYGNGRMPVRIPWKSDILIHCLLLTSNYLCGMWCIFFLMIMICFGFV